MSRSCSNVLAVVVALAALAGCGPGKPPASLAEVERVVVVSDQAAASPTYATSYSALLEHNDDALFPSFRGKDLAALRQPAKVVRFDRAADGFVDLAKATDFPCRCAGAACSPACIDTESHAGTVVVVQLGVNDLLSVFFQLVSSPSLRADPQSAFDELRASADAVLTTLTDRKLFARPPLVLVTNVPDPSDGVGDLAAKVKATFPVQGIPFEAVDEALCKQVLDGFDQALREAAAAHGATYVDLRARFLGHGYHFDDAQNANHHPDDATTWYRSLVDPNLRGAHELRRAVWEALAKEEVPGIPTDLPADSTLGLPPVPASGWANEVAARDLMLELSSPKFGPTPLPNVARDARKAVGPPDGTDNSVAIGVVGNFLVLDLGEGEEVTDGEGADLVVLENGLKSGGVPERYRVLLSSSKDGPFVAIAEGAGEQAFDLAGSGVSKARFVRLESLVRVSDIENGMGSPLYPGPEIDAVGAVHPGQP